MKNKLVWYIALLIIGAVLYVSAEYLQVIESFWGGMGIGFLFISIIRLGQIGRYRKDPQYAKQLKVKHSDERNRYIASKARAHTFYYSIILAGVSIIVLYVVGLPEIAQIVSFVLCGQLIMYYGMYLFLRTRY